jgi:transcriptional regulator with XRE-family HTH domain
MSELEKNLKQEFVDKIYRHSYAEEFLNSSIATQIKVLREQRKWRQADLAVAAEMKQSVISRLENVNYSSWSIKSLQKLAEAFDVVLTVKFERFRNLVLDAQDFSRKKLEVPEFESDPFFKPAGTPERLQTPAYSELLVAPDVETFEREFVAAPLFVMSAGQTLNASQYELAAGG